MHLLRELIFLTRSYQLLFPVRHLQLRHLILVGSLESMTLCFNLLRNTTQLS